MEDAEPNRQRVQRIQLPPDDPPAREPQANAPTQKPPPLAKTTTPAQAEQAHLSAAAQPPPDAAQPVPPPATPNSASSQGNTVAWIVGVVVLGVVLLVLVLNSTPHDPSVGQRTPIEAPPSTQSIGSPATNPSLPPREPTVAQAPKASRQSLAPDKPIVQSSPPRTPSKRASPATPAPKVETGRTYPWRGRTYYIPPNQMQRFNAIKIPARKKLAEMDKLTDQMNSIGLQMQKADKKTKSRLASQRDALSAQHSEASAEYARLVSEMDQLMSSLANP
jgi:hypothetical protein